MEVNGEKFKVMVKEWQEVMSALMINCGGGRGVGMVGRGVQYFSS